MMRTLQRVPAARGSDAFPARANCSYAAIGREGLAEGVAAVTQPALQQRADARQATRQQEGGREGASVEKGHERDAAERMHVAEGSVAWRGPATIVAT